MASALMFMEHVVITLYVKINQINNVIFGCPRDTSFTQHLKTIYAKIMLLNFFSNSFDDSLIVYRGAPNVRAIFPEKKNINTFDFQNVKSLAEYLLSVGSSEEKYTALLKQKHSYRMNYRDYYCSFCEWATNSQNPKPGHIKRDFNEWFRTNKCQTVHTDVV